MAIPKRLGKEPLIEVIWQVQFDPPEGLSVGEILPGILFSALRGEQPGLRLVRLPAAEIPPFVAQNDPGLRFAPQLRLEAPDWPFLFHLGNRVVTVNCRAPYVGWDAFRGRVLGLIDILESSGLIDRPTRYSLRYIDLIRLEPPPALGFLRLDLAIGDHRIERRPLQMRVEIPEDSCIHVLQIATPARVRTAQGEQEGALVDIESVAHGAETGWASVREDLETLHNASKALFFEKILTPEAIDALEPEY